MNEQLCQNPLEALCSNWKKLNDSLYDCDEISIDFFLETFKETEECLRQCLKSDTISKEFIPLIADVYAFAYVKVSEHRIPEQAAQILSERMLSQYVVAPVVSEQNAYCVNVYILQTKRQITIDFTDAAIAFHTIKNALQF